MSEYHIVNYADANKKEKNSPISMSMKDIYG